MLQCVHSSELHSVYGIVMDPQSDANQVASKYYAVPSVRNAIMILDFLGQDGHRRSSLAQISNALGISKSSAYNVLKTLQDAAFVQFHPTGKRYSLGLALLHLGSIVADDMDHLSIARPYVHELAAEVQQTCLVARWVEDRLVVLHCEEPLHDLRVTMAVGQQLRYISGAFGKAYLAFAPRPPPSPNKETQTNTQ